MHVCEQSSVHAVTGMLSVHAVTGMLSVHAVTGMLSVCEDPLPAHVSDAY